MFGSDAIRAAAILADEGAKGFDRMATSLGKVKAADVAATRMDNLKGRLEQLKGSMETLGINIGTILLPAVSLLVGALTRLTNWFLNLSTGQQRFLTITIAAVAGILLTVAAVGKLIIFLARLKTALILLRVPMLITWLIALGPIALLIAGILILIGIIYLLIKNWDKVKSVAVATWTLIANQAKNLGSTIKEIFTDALDWVVDKFSGLQDHITGFFSDAGSWLLNAGRDIVQGLIDGIMDMIDDLAGAAGKIAGTIGKFLPGSPVKQGPLKILNRGYAGEQIVQMVLDGLDGMAGPLARAMDDVVSVPNGYARPGPGATGRPRRRRGLTNPRQGMRIEGGLVLRGDTAYITGVALDADSDDDDYNDTLGRMNR